MYFFSQIQSSNFHILCARRPSSHISTTAVLSPEINQIITRFESTEAHTKDVILNLPQEPVLSSAAPLSDNLPDITTLESISSDIPDIVTEAAVVLVSLVLMYRRYRCKKSSVLFSRTIF